MNHTRTQAVGETAAVSQAVPLKFTLPTEHLLQPMAHMWGQGASDSAHDHVCRCADSSGVAVGSMQDQHDASQALSPTIEGGTGRAAEEPAAAMSAVLSSPLAWRLALHAAALQPGRPVEDRQRARQALSGLLDEMTAAAGEDRTCIRSKCNHAARHRARRALPASQLRCLLQLVRVVHDACAGAWVALLQIRCAGRL